MIFRRAYQGEDLRPLGAELIAYAHDNPIRGDEHALMDAATIMYLYGEKMTAQVMQRMALERQRLYHLDAPCGEAAIRLLAIMAPGDMMANTPVGCLLEGSDISLDLLYCTEGLLLPEPLPEHDVLLVAVGYSDEFRSLLEQLAQALESWPRPVINAADRIPWQERDLACTLLADLPRLVIPPTVRLDRNLLTHLGEEALSPQEVLPEGKFPLIIRPVDSHAGRGLEKIDSPAGLLDYLEKMSEDQFYVSRFIDYRSQDGVYRKYRIVLIGDRPYACHMGISDHWMIHYANAGMMESTAKRAEEEGFMQGFDAGFARKHEKAFQGISDRMQLQYVVLDCAETPDGALLLFEIDSRSFVHAMDPVDLFPYKQPQMQKVFAAFRALLIDAMTHHAA
jgi:glutathione synthase/RimK-type ligase-like ATP-grasp enzyme